ncbi:hypothetical protein N8I74_01040 [Chitiniphilus purpureus]|uniref:Uncharacterized protein n=1 Tax=Chitiniphilus purpureus TaxID=2981137 RepID=A0ABY6DMN4_9NEIS|nr:hypothetical protein [Chitiniphilus sp. CD1]UXY15630.1 hypothetical protein N8I74_01040 [Chitiniphilus sp. CD1]
MQASELQQRFSRIERCIDQAAQACQISANVPQALQRTLSELDRESDNAKQQLRQQQDDASLLACVDRLEKLGDQAMQACRSADGLDPALRQAIQQAHDELSQLKHQLH